MWPATPALVLTALICTVSKEKLLSLTHSLTMGKKQLIGYRRDVSNCILCYQIHQQLENFVVISLQHSTLLKVWKQQEFRSVHPIWYPNEQVNQVSQSCFNPSGNSIFGFHNTAQLATHANHLSNAMLTKGPKYFWDPKIEINCSVQHFKMSPKKQKKRKPPFISISGNHEWLSCEKQLSDISGFSGSYF